MMIFMVELTGDDLSMFSNFESITHVMPSDYLNTESSIIFLVSADSLGKAIGKKAANIERLKVIFRKRVIIVADSDDPELFVRNFFGNIQIFNTEIRDVMGEKFDPAHDRREGPRHRDRPRRREDKGGESIFEEEVQRDRPTEDETPSHLILSNSSSILPTRPVFQLFLPFR